MKKKNYISLICINCSIALILFDFFKYDVFIKANYSFGLLMVVGVLSYIPYILFIWNINNFDSLVYYKKA